MDTGAGVQIPHVESGTVRAAKATLATVLVALICVAASVAASQKIKLRIDAVSHTYAPNGNYLCARISGTAGAHLLVEVYGPGVGEGHVFTQSMIGRNGKVTVGFALAAEGDHRVKVTANKPKQGRAVVTKDYAVPAQDIAVYGRFSCI